MPVSHAPALHAGQQATGYDGPPSKTVTVKTVKITES